MVGIKARFKVNWFTFANQPKTGIPVNKRPTRDMAFSIKKSIRLSSHSGLHHPSVMSPEPVARGCLRHGIWNIFCYIPWERSIRDLIGNFLGRVPSKSKYYRLNPGIFHLKVGQRPTPKRYAKMFIQKRARLHPACASLHFDVGFERCRDLHLDELREAFIKVQREAGCEFQRSPTSTSDWIWDGWGTKPFSNLRSEFGSLWSLWSEKNSLFLLVVVEGAATSVTAMRVKWVNLWKHGNVWTHYLAESCIRIYHQLKKCEK